MDYQNSYLYENSRVETSTLIKNIFMWMAAGLGITGVVAYSVFNTGLAIQLIRSGMMFPLIIAEFALVFILSRNVMKFKATTAIALFFSYSALNGLTLSTIFLAYTYSSIANTFFITALLFGFMALYGMTTKRDLTKLGTYLIMGLVGIIITSVINFFLRSSGLDFMISILGVIIFTGLTAYDVQKFSRLSSSFGSANSETGIKVSIIGALNLYLDFINLFLFLLRFLGRRK